MTTDLRVLRAADVFVDNDVLCLPLDRRAAEQPLAGAAWLVCGAAPKDAHRRALSHAASLVITKLTGYVLWLLAGHTAWQPDSRVTRHRKLWGALKARHLVAPFGRSTEEQLVETADGIRFFGGIQLGLGSLEQVIAILEAEPISHLVALKVQDGAVAERLVHDGWERARVGPSASVVSAVKGVGGIVFRLVGDFDDRESGCVALAKPEVLDELMN